MFIGFSAALWFAIWRWPRIKGAWWAEWRFPFYSYPASRFSAILGSLLGVAMGFCLLASSFDALGLPLADLLGWPAAVFVIAGLIVAIPAAIQDFRAHRRHLRLQKQQEEEEDKLLTKRQRRKKMRQNRWRQPS